MQEVKFTRGWAKGPVSAEEPRRSSAPVLHLPSLAEAQGRHPQDPGGNKCKSICVQASRLEDPVMLTAHQWQSFAEKWVPQKSPGAKYIHRGT
ncbi:hypothetical protein VULLAG_LOCUS13887 [Vulpes lagopus]